MLQCSARSHSRIPPNKKITQKRNVNKLCMLKICIQLKWSYFAKCIEIVKNRFLKNSIKLLSNFICKYKKLSLQRNKLKYLTKYRLLCPSTEGVFE